MNHFSFTLLDVKLHAPIALPFKAAVVTVRTHIAYHINDLLWYKKYHVEHVLGNSAQLAIMSLSIHLISGKHL